MNIDNIKMAKVLKGEVDSRIPSLINNLTTSDFGINYVNLWNLNRIITDILSDSYAIEFIRILFESQPDLLEYVEEIPEDLFSSCDWLTEINIPSNIERIECRAFLGCLNLEKINFLDNGSSQYTLKYIDTNAFTDCVSLKRIELPPTVKKIDDDAFEGCSELEYILLPKNYYRLGADVFENCRKLEEIHYNGSKEDWTSSLNTRSSYWDRYSVIRRVICTDGEIEIPYEEF